ncbi:MAG: D-alanine--D-alanine ligase [Deltaproteobacteria bacterium]|nr:D-alanine--D-alanine ligase [Deltaproteobacteria bacterium]
MVVSNIERRHVGVLLGGRSAERDVSLQTGQAVVEVLRKSGVQVSSIDVDLDVAERIKALSIDVAFIALHGRFGEDGCIQGLLESLRIPYTGSGVLASAMAMDKVTSKRLFDAAGLATARWAFGGGAEQLPLPVIVKPRAEGSSVGLELVDSAERLAVVLADNPELLVEEYIPGRELSVAVIGKRPAVELLGPAIEVKPAEGIYDYAAKYERDDTIYIVDPDLPPPVRERMEHLAIAAHQLLECCGVSRIDFRYDEDTDRLVLLEINTLPGLTSHSLVPKIAAHAGISYTDLVLRIIDQAGLHA